MKRLWPYLVTFIVAALSLATFLALDRAWVGEAQAEQRSEVAAQLSAFGDGVQSELQSRLAPATALVALVAHAPDLEQKEFERAAEHLVASTPGIRSLTLARGSSITHVHPLEPNRKALGLNLAVHPIQGAVVNRAIAERVTILSGPVELVQGGRAFIGRTPIYLGEDSSEYWGLATVLIDSDHFLNRMAERVPQLRLSLRGKDAVGAAGAHFFGDRSVLAKDPVFADVVVPGGSWGVTAVPIDGWVQRPRNALWRRSLGGLVVVLLTLLVGLVLLGNQRLRLRTEELSSALGEVQTLKGLLPVCSNCKSVRDDQGIWSRIERYIEENSDVEVTHSICPTCLVELYGPEVAERVLAGAAREGEESSADSSDPERRNSPTGFRTSGD